MAWMEHGQLFKSGEDDDCSPRHAVEDHRPVPRCPLMDGGFLDLFAYHRRLYAPHILRGSFHVAINRCAMIDGMTDCEEAHFRPDQLQ